MALIHHSSELFSVLCLKQYNDVTWEMLAKLIRNTIAISKVMWKKVGILCSHTEIWGPLDKRMFIGCTCQTPQFFQFMCFHFFIPIIFYIERHFKQYLLLIYYYTCVFCLFQLIFRTHLGISIPILTKRTKKVYLNYSQWPGALAEARSLSTFGG